MKLSSRFYVIRTTKQLKALASSARQEIVDVLSQMGTVSASELASALGRPADAIYYHLRVLVRAGLVVHAGDRNQGRRQEELFRTVSSELQLGYKLGKGGNVSEISAIVGSMLRLGIRDFRQAFQSGEARVSGSGRELWALRTTGWLRPQELIRVNQSIKSLAQKVSNPRGRGRLYGITVLLTPLDHRARGKRTRANRAKGKRN